MEVFLETFNLVTTKKSKTNKYKKNFVQCMSLPTVMT